LKDPKDLLLIFTRNPEPGKCKTRLAATLGDKVALEIYLFLLEHTVKITRNLSASKKVCYSETIWQHDIWDNDIYDKELQQGRDLGERMANAFKKGFSEGYEHIIIIGSDMLHLSGSDLEKAFACLEKNDFVLGPATDGGYYLLGMKNFNEQLFKDKQWGTKTVLGDSLADLKKERVALLETKNDIDVYEDIKDDDAFLPFIRHLKDD
jgi:rSAM/selenodomain-associated transferase 1